MNTPHQDFQKAKEELIDLLKHHEAVLAFQEAEESIGQIPQISDLAGQMKAYQQEAVLFQKIEKQRAYEEAGEQADLIQHELENLPIVHLHAPRIMKQTVCEGPTQTWKTKCVHF